MKPVVKSILKTLAIVLVAVIIVIVIGRSGSEEHSNIKQIALLQYNDSPLSEFSKEGIIDGLNSIGMVEGVDYELKANNAQGDVSTLNIMVESALNDKPDLFFVTSTPTLQVVARKIKDIPVVFTVVADPIAAGVGSSFTNHLPNITGISTMGDYAGMAKWLKILMPGIQSVGTLYTPGEINSVKNLEEFKKYTQEAGIELWAVPVNSSSDVNDAALALASKKPDAICQIIDNLTSGAFSGIVKVASSAKIPLFGFVSEQAKEGAVFVVSRNYHQSGVDASLMAQKIFEGRSPETIPFEYVSKTDVIINLNAAAYYGITFPDEVINYPDLITIGLN